MIGWIELLLFVFIQYYIETDVFLLVEFFRLFSLT